MPEFTLGTPLRGSPDANSNIPCLWCDLWIIIKGPHSYMVTTPGLCVRSPLVYTFNVEVDIVAARSQACGNRF